MNTYWLERTEADLPTEDDWLSAAEGLQLRGLRFAKRRADWRLGRWTAKCAVAGYLNLSLETRALAAIEVRAAASGAPEAFLDGQSAAVSISLSHSGRRAACAIASQGAALGCDLELIEPRSDAFIADYFTVEERASIMQTAATERPLLVTLLWSAKESALKALREGLRLDTRSVEVTCGPAAFLAEAAWHPLQVQCTDGHAFHGWWQRDGNLMRTLVAVPAPAQPIVLEPGCCAWLRRTQAAKSMLAG